MAAAWLWWLTLPLVVLLIRGRLHFDKRYDKIHAREHTAMKWYHPTCMLCLGELDSARQQAAAQRQLQTDQQDWNRLHGNS